MFNQLETNTSYQQSEIVCPIISRAVICDSCGSPDFSIDEFSPRSILGNKVPGMCDECGHRKGKLLKT